jgi:acid stress-induced BolA-like protein IbaG/YrbA
MSLDVIGSPPDLGPEIRRCIEAALPGARVEVVAGSPGHYAIRVTSTAFAGKSRVAQQQLVYGAIQHLMAGDAAPLHAVDELVTRTPA